MKKVYLLVAILLVVSLIAVSCAKPAPAPPAPAPPAPAPPAPAPAPPPAPAPKPEVVRLSYAGGAEGSGTYACAIAVASIVNKYSDRIEISVEVSPGTAMTPPMIQEDLVLLAAGSTTAEVYSAEGSEKGGYEPCPKVCRFFVWGQAAYVLFCLEDKPIYNIHDLVGKKVGMGAETQPTGIRTKAVLELLGLLDKCSVSYTSTGTELIDRIKDGLYDVGFYGVSHPWAPLMDLATTRDTRIFGVTGEDLDKVVEMLAPAYFAAKTPANIYRGQTEPVETFLTLQTTLASVDLPEDVGYEILKILEENIEEFGIAYPPAGVCFLDFDVQTTNPVVPYHPATKRWLKEHGVSVD